MRTIKFRGKCIDNYLWEYGWLYCKDGKYYIKDGVNDTVKLFLVNQDTIGQFTGLSDRTARKYTRATLCKDWNMPTSTLE